MKKIVKLCLSLPFIWGGTLIASTGNQQYSAFIAEAQMSNDDILHVCANPQNIIIDFSSINLTDEHLKAVFEGLVERQKKQRITV